MSNDKNYVVVRFDWKDAAGTYLHYLEDRKVRHSCEGVYIRTDKVGVRITLHDSWNNDKRVSCETHVYFMGTASAAEAVIVDEFEMASMVHCKHSDGGYRIVSIKARRINYNYIEPTIDDMRKEVFDKIKKDQASRMAEEAFNNIEIIFNGPATIVIGKLPNGMEKKVVVKDANYGKGDVAKGSIERKVAGIDWALCKMKLASSSNESQKILWQCLKAYGNDQMAHMIVASNSFDKQVIEKLYRKYIPGWKSNWQKAKEKRKAAKNLDVIETTGPAVSYEQGNDGMETTGPAVNPEQIGW